MSLLEDVFLEDEAGEAQELERVIEGDDYEGGTVYPNSDDNEEKDDEAVEDKRRVDPTQTKTKRVVNPRFVLNPARLTGPKGIQIIPKHFKDFKFKGKGHEKEDLDVVLKKLEHWAYRLYPKFGFHDCLKKMETLGKKRTVMVHLQKIRSDQLLSEETVEQKDSSDDETQTAPPVEDEFDKLLQQQIELARTTPAPGSVKKPPYTPSADRKHMMPKATSSPSISEDQKERMLRNRRLAEERRLARLKNNSGNDITSTPQKETIIEENESEVVGKDEVVVRKHNRSHIIDSDSSDEDVVAVNKSITIGVDIHCNGDKNNDEVEVNNGSSDTKITDNNRRVLVIDEAGDSNRNHFDILLHVNNEKVSADVVDKTNDSKNINNSKDEMEAVDIEKDGNVTKDSDNIASSNVDNPEINLVIDAKQSQNINENCTEDADLYLKSNDSVVDSKSNETPAPITDNSIHSERNVDKSDDINLNIDAENSVLDMNKENVAEDVMDVDFSDDF